MSDFSNRPIGEQIAVIYEKIQNIEKLLSKQNGNVSRNCKDILIIKVILITAGILISVLMGLGVPTIPW
jgi:CHASE3 domain sensor protein